MQPKRRVVLSCSLCGGAKSCPRCLACTGCSSRNVGRCAACQERAEYSRAFASEPTRGHPRPARDTRGGADDGLWAPSVSQQLHEAAGAGAVH